MGYTLAEVRLYLAAIDRAEAARGRSDLLRAALAAQAPWDGGKGVREALKDAR